MNPLLRLQTWYDYVRSSLWVTPTAAVVGAVALGAWLVHVKVGPHGTASAIVYGGSAAGARAMLQAIAGSVITVTSLTFSLTVVTLQLASSQFSPRLLRTFARDPVTQVVLAVFLGTFAYSLTVLRRIHGQAGNLSRSVPDVAVTVGFAWALASTGFLVWFISHLTQVIRVDHMMQSVERDTLTTLRQVYPRRLADTEGNIEAPRVPERAEPVRARRPGYIQALAPAPLIELAAKHDMVVRLEVAPGDHLVRGRPIAWYWPSGAEFAADPPEADQLDVRFDEALELGYERTTQQDVAYGLRQLVDIAVRAMSPGVNDPTTATHALGHLSVVLRELADRHISPQVLRDDDGTPRLHVVRPSFDDYLELACAQIRRYSAGEPDVLVALLRMLRDIASGGVTNERRDALLRQAELVSATAERGVDDAAELRRVGDELTTTRAWLAGDQRPSSG